MPRTFTGVSASPSQAAEGLQEAALAGTLQPVAPPSFETIFHDYTPYLWRSLLGLGVSPSDVEDVCQEVLLIVHRKLAEVQPTALRSWLYGICVRVAANHRRSARLRHETLTERLPEQSLPPNQPDRVDAERLHSRLLAVLNQLDDSQREAFVLYEIEQMTLREVAEAVGSPLQTVYSRLEAARDAVQRAFSSPTAGGDR